MMIWCARKKIVLLSMFKTVVLLNIFLESVMHFLSGFFLSVWRAQKKSIYLK